jgi:hypothetical protein
VTAPEAKTRIAAPYRNLMRRRRASINAERMSIAATDEHTPHAVRLKNGSA